MVKNHARKNDARARQAATGETFPEAMRNSAPTAVEMLNTANRRPVIHLGNGVHFDMNAEKPNLHITGAFGSGKTWLVNHIVDELIASKVNCEIVVIAGKEEQHASAKKLRADKSQTTKIALLRASHKGDPTYEELLLEEIAAKVKDEDYSTYRDAPLILIVDGINEVSDESTILLQTIAKHGVKRGIHTIITSNDGYGDLPIAIRSSGDSITLGWVGYAQYRKGNGRPVLFSIGAPEVSDGTITLGSQVLTQGTLRSLLIINDEKSPEARRSDVAMDLAHQVLRKGWGVTVLSDAANEVNWRMTFGKSIHLATKDAAFIIDDLARDRIDMDERTSKETEIERWQSQNSDPKRRLLIVDGYFEEDSSSHEYQLDVAAFVNYIRSSKSSIHIPVVMTCRNAPWYYSLFANAVIVASKEVPDQHVTGEVNSDLMSMGVTGVGGRKLGHSDAVLVKLGLPADEPVVFSIDSLLSEKGNKARRN